MERTDILIIVAGPEENGTADALPLHWSAKITDQRRNDWPWNLKVVTLSVDPDFSPAEAFGPSDVVGGWEILSLISGTSLVHVSRPHTRAGEIAVLAGRSLGRPIVVSEISTVTSQLGRSFGLLALADSVICGDADESSSCREQSRVELLRLGQGAWLSQLRDIYGRLFIPVEARA